jgi:hypothetical protein
MMTSLRATRSNPSSAKRYGSPRALYALAMTALLLAACGIKGDLTRPADIKEKDKKESNGSL